MLLDDRTELVIILFIIPDLSSFLSYLDYKFKDFFGS